MIVLDAKGRPTVLIEVDNQKNLDETKAIAFRRDVLPHLGGAPAPHLLLVSQERAYLWSKGGSDDYNGSPSASFAMAEVVSHYGHKNGRQDAPRLRGSTLELLVWRWFLDLVHRPDAASAGVPVPEPIEALIAEIRGGTVHTESAT